jgi:hypothetical protein
MVELTQVDEEQEVSVWKVLEVRYEDLIFVDKTERMPDKDIAQKPLPQNSQNSQNSTRPPKRFQYLSQLQCLRKSSLMCWTSLRRSVPPTHYYSLLVQYNTEMSDSLFLQWHTEMSRDVTPLVLVQEVLKNRQHATHTNPIVFEDNPLSCGNHTDITSRLCPGSCVVFLLSPLLRVPLNVCSQSQYNSTMLGGHLWLRTPWLFSSSCMNPSLWFERLGLIESLMLSEISTVGSTSHWEPHSFQSVTPSLRSPSDKYH